MKKRAIILAFLLVLPLVYARQHFVQVPDLTVTSINIPDSVPLNTVLNELSFTITNNGPGTLTSRSVPVQIKVTDGTSVLCDVREVLRNRPLETYEYIRRDTDVNLPPEKSLTWTADLRSCRAPVRKPITLIVTIDPATPPSRGTIMEANEYNNDFIKTIGIAPPREPIPQPQSVTVDLHGGLTYFSVPVMTETTGNQLLLETRCSRLQETTPQQGAERIKRPAPIRPNSFTTTDTTKPLRPGIIYRIECIDETKYTFTGYDPGPFSLPLNSKTTTPVPTRADLKNHNLDRIADCPGARVTGFGSLGPAGRRKPAPSGTGFDFYLKPGEVYLVYCPQDGIWDPLAVEPKPAPGRKPTLSYRR